MKHIQTIFGQIMQFESSSAIDTRGSFLKIFNTSLPVFKKFSIKQINYVTTAKKNTIRGFHFQTGKFSEAKIFSVPQGGIQLAFIDIQKKSKSYLKFGYIILAQPNQSVFIPRGFATAYCTLKNNTTVLYLSDNFYNPTLENGIRWNDPAIAFPWETKNPITSKKDNNWPLWTV